MMGMSDKSNVYIYNGLSHLLSNGGFMGLECSKLVSSREWYYL